MGCLFNNGDKGQEITIVGGEGSATFQGLAGRRLVHLFIKPETATTTYSWKYTDKNGNEFICDEGWVGDRDVLDSKQLIEYTYGNFTITIFSSDTDEDFKIIPVVSEET